MLSPGVWEDSQVDVRFPATDLLDLFRHAPPVRHLALVVARQLPVTAYLGLAVLLPAPIPHRLAAPNTNVHVLPGPPSRTALRRSQPSVNVTLDSTHPVTPESPPLGPTMSRKPQE